MKQYWHFQELTGKKIMHTFPELTPNNDIFRELLATDTFPSFTSLSNNIDIFRETTRKLIG